MTATYSFDVFSSLDGFGSADGDWTGYWGKQGPELLDHRFVMYGEEQRMVFGANTFRAFVQMLAASTEGSEVRDPWVTRMRNLPANRRGSHHLGRHVRRSPGAHGVRACPRRHRCRGPSAPDGAWSDAG